MSTAQAFKIRLEKELGGISLPPARDSATASIFFNWTNGKWLGGLNQISRRAGVIHSFPRGGRVLGSSAQGYAALSRWFRQRLLPRRHSHSALALHRTLRHHLLFAKLTSFQFVSLFGAGQPNAFFDERCVARFFQRNLVMSVRILSGATALDRQHSEINYMSNFKLWKFFCMPAFLLCCASIQGFLSSRL